MAYSHLLWNLVIIMLLNGLEFLDLIIAKSLAELKFVIGNSRL